MKALRHVGIVVADLKRALKFYRDLLGLKIAKINLETGEYIDQVTGLDRVKVSTLKLAAKDGSLVELLYYHSPCLKFLKARKLNHPGLSHIAFTVKDVDRKYRRLKNKGVKFNSRPCISADGYAKVAFCQDPDGLFIELVEVLKK